MPGPRQPTALVEAKGRKHLSRSETDERLDREVHVPPPERASPPKWLPKRLHEEFHEVGEILLSAGLYAELDRDVLAQYFLARDRWLKADKKAAAAIRADDEKLAREWTGVQGTYFRQARQCAESMGLSVPLPDRGACGVGQCRGGPAGRGRRVHPPPAGPPGRGHGEGGELTCGGSL